VSIQGEGRRDGVSRRTIAKKSGGSLEGGKTSQSARILHRGEGVGVVLHRVEQRGAIEREKVKPGAHRPVNRGGAA